MNNPTENTEDNIPTIVKEPLQYAGNLLVGAERHRRSTPFGAAGMMAEAGVDFLGDVWNNIFDGGGGSLKKHREELQRIRNGKQYPPKEVDYNNNFKVGPGRSDRYSAIYAHNADALESGAIRGKYTPGDPLMNTAHYQLNWTPSVLTYITNIANGTNFKNTTDDALTSSEEAARSKEKRERIAREGASQAYFYYKENPHLNRAGLLNDFLYNGSVYNSNNKQYQDIYTTMQLNLHITPEQWNQAVTLLTEDLGRRLSESVSINTNHDRDEVTKNVGAGYTVNEYYAQGNIHNLETEYTYLPTWQEQRFYILRELMSAAISPERHPLIGNIITPRATSLGYTTSGLWAQLSHNSYESNGFTRFHPDMFEVTGMTFDRKHNRIHNKGGPLMGQGYFTFNMNTKPNEEWISGTDWTLISFPWTQDGSLAPENLDTEWKHYKKLEEEARKVKYWSTGLMMGGH